MGRMQVVDELIIRAYRDPTNGSIRYKLYVRDSEVETEESESVPYSTFRQLLGRNHLAYLYEVNYEQRRKGSIVPVVTEPLVQTIWRRKGFVPREVYDYVAQNFNQITKMRRMPRVKWNLEYDKTLLDLLRQLSPNLLEVAFRFRERHRVRMTIGTIRGRFYNYMRQHSRRKLRQGGLTREQISFVHERQISL